MAVHELDASAVALEEIKNAVLSLKKAETVLVLRGGGRRLSRNEWHLFLRDTCHLILDQRQYNFDEQLELTDWWEISYQPDKATSYAYSNTRQPLHNDNAWFADPAEINFFVMEKQASHGGEQTVYPVSRLISDLSSEQPELFRDLCDIPVTIQKGDGKYFNRTTIIVLGEDPKVFWNYYRIDRQSPGVASMCEAFFAFLENKEASSSVERRRSETGDCICFNDQKMLHGRAAFTATAAYDRVLMQSMWKFP